MHDATWRQLSSEPVHDKTNKITCAQWSLRSAWASAQSGQSLRYPHEEAWGPSLPFTAHSEDWSDWADARADLRLRLAHMWFFWFCRASAHLVFIIGSRKLSHVLRKPVYAICEQQAQISLRSLISAFVVRCLDSIIPLVSISEISSLSLASVAEQAGWVLPGRKPRRQVFSWRDSIVVKQIMQEVSGTVLKAIVFCHM